MGTSEIVSQAYLYVDRGWSVIPLHESRILPIEREWQINARRTRTDVDAAWSLYPGANIGVVTGRVSGCWVLDIDPDNGGSVALAGLVQAYGRLPETYTVRTPSGGTHYYFLIPPDFEPHNAQHGRRSGRLPAGIDVRGWHGYVAAPPSQRAPYGTKRGGAYAIETDFPLSPAPEWLLDMIRPAIPHQRDEPPEIPAVSGGAGPEFVDRGRAYAAAAVNGALTELAQAVPGTRNETAFRVACRLIELANSPWSGLAREQVYAAFIGAARLADVDASFSDAEAAGVWVSAVRKVGAAGVALPEADFYGSVVPFAAMGGDVAGFTQPATASATVAGPMATISFVAPAEADAGAAYLEPATAPAAIVAADPREVAVMAEMSRQWVREEAARRLREIRAGAFTIEILDRMAQMRMPTPAPLVAGWLAQGQVARIFGPPGAGKSFVAVELAACVSTGTPWHGHRVEAGEVAYFAPEDPSGVALRLRAWERHHDIEHRVSLIPTSLRLDTESVDPILAALRAHSAERSGGDLRLIVIDTQAMVTVGMDENDAGQMGPFVEAVKRLAVATGASVLIVHHSGIKGGRARGSTSILGALDVEMEAAITGRTVTVASTKQKNIAKPSPIMMNLHTVDMAEIDAFGQPVTSCVLVAAGDPGTPVVFVEPGAGMGLLERRALAIATVLVETNATGETYSRVRTRAAGMVDFGKTPGTVVANFSKAWAFLVERGRVAKAAGREAFYFIEIEGADRLEANPDKKVSGSPELYVPQGD